MYICKVADLRFLQNMQSIISTTIRCIHDLLCFGLRFGLVLYGPVVAPFMTGRVANLFIILTVYAMYMYDINGNLSLSTFMQIQKFPHLV